MRFPYRLKDLNVQKNFDYASRFLFRSVRGRVNTTTPTIVGGKGFTLTRNGAGDVTVTFSQPFIVTPVVVVGMGETAVVLMVKLHAVTPPSPTGFRVAILTPAGVLTDGDFTFIASDPS